MGGVVKPVAKAVGLAKTVTSQPVQAEAPVEKAVAKASRSEEEMGARMRGARRRGRQLLSDARLNAEAGVETLGGGNNLG
jgi:predicted methyltransferase